MVIDLPAPWVLAAGLAAAALLAELLHLRRVRRVAPLVFGPSKRPAWWASSAPLLRVLALAASAWGLATLLELPAKKHSADGESLRHSEAKEHVLLVLDVSPSMRLEDAGPEKKQSRTKRAREVLDSFFNRVPLERYRISVIAVYTGAKPVVEDTVDMEVVRNILGDLPMEFAFQSGKTQLFEGLEAAAEMARPWAPRSTLLLLVSDGDTVPATGMPRMPASVRETVVVGVGDPLTGKFIDGRQSRQDVTTLRQIATRMGGVFHNGNEKHLSSLLLADLTAIEGEGPLEKLTRREYALIALASGSCVLAFLPLLLAAFGTRFRPGVRHGTPGPAVRAQPAQ